MFHIFCQKYHLRDVKPPLVALNCALYTCRGVHPGRLQLGLGPELNSWVVYRPSIKWDCCSICSKKSRVSSVSPRQNSFYEEPNTCLLFYKAVCLFSPLGNAFGKEKDPDREM